jgi:small-conductance mechanosensitive channel
MIGVLIMLQSLGISITPIITALGVGGLAVALALQDTLSNLFSGLQILISRQLRPGDYIRLDTGEEGYVADITWRNTTIRALPNNMIVVPNAKLASSIIVTNYYMPEQEMSVLVQVGVAYESDLEKVEKVTIEVAKEVMKEVPGGVPEFEPFTRYHTFADFSINFSVILRAKEVVDQYLIKHEFVKRLHRRYLKEGIQIPFPIRTIHMKESPN